MHVVLHVNNISFYLEENVSQMTIKFIEYSTALWNHLSFSCTANMCSEITVEVHWKNCNFEKLQFFTVDLSSLYFLQVKNCNFSIIFHVVYFALNWMLILQVFTVFQEYNKKTVKIELKNCKFGLSKLLLFFFFL